MSVNLNDNRKYSHRVPFWNWEDNTKDLSKVDMIRLKYFEVLTNNFWDCTQLWWKLVNMSVNNKKYYHRLPLMHVPFWNWEDNTKDSYEVDKIRPKYFEWPTNHFCDSLYAIFMESGGYEC